MKTICPWVFLLFFIFTGLSSYGQAGSKPINLDSLSAEDEALFLEYKDSFNTEMQNFLFLFGDGRKMKWDTIVADMNRRSHAEIGLDFSSRMLINGRETGLNGVGFYPSATYVHKYGFHFGLALCFYTDSTIARASPVPAVVLNAGYQHTFFKRWLLAAMYTRTFLTYGTSTSRGLLNNTLLLSTGVDVWKRLIVSSALFIDWSSFRNRKLPAFDRRSIEIGFSLRKDFVFYKIIGAKVFTISPSINFFFATDNLAFIRKRTAAEQKISGLGQFTTSIDHFFGFVDVEPAVTIDWRIRNFEITATPTLAIPFNEFDYDLGERIKNPKHYRFYVQAGLRYFFAVKKKAAKHKASKA